MSRPHLPRARRRRFGRDVGAIALVLGLATATMASPSAGAQVRAPQQRARPAPPFDLSRVRALGPIRDRVIVGDRSAQLRRSALARAARAVVYSDSAGHEFTIAAGEPSVPATALDAIAGILAATYHRWELAYLSVTVVASSSIPALCGPDAQACYVAEDPKRSFKGSMFVAFDDPDLVHAVVHEYGHHVDNSLLNLAHIMRGCTYANDGSRRWTVARALEDDLLRLGTCDSGAQWQRQLGEVFAEDYVALNGIDEWNRIALFGAPSRNVLRALATDIEEPFAPSQRTLRGRVTRSGVVRRLVVHLTVPTFLLAELRGPRRAELDLRLYWSSRRRPIERSAHRGSRESLARFVLPGRYTIEIRGRRRGGQWRLWLGKL